MSGPDIPFEVFDRILTYVAAMKLITASNPTLSSCYQVCRSWNIATLPYYFKFAGISSSLDRCAALCVLIKARPAIAPAIQMLVFQGDLNINLPDDNPWILETSSLLFGKLPNVYSMTIVSIYETGEFASPQLFANLASFSKVKILNIIGCLVPTSLLFAYISCFPAVEQLMMSGFGDMERFPNLFKQEVEYPPPALRSFRAKGVPLKLETILSWMAASPSKYSLRSVVLSVIGWEDSVAEVFFREIGPVLEELDLKITESEDYDVNASNTPANIGECTNLRSLTIRTAINPRVQVVLDSLRSMKLEYLGFSVPEITKSHLGAYKTLAESLGTLYLPPCFKGVRFFYKGYDSDMWEAQMDLEEIFQKFTAKYPIVVVHTSDVQRWWFH